MKKHRNGSVTLTAAEIVELNQAYQDMYSILTDAPGYIGDYFQFNDRARLVGVFRWSAQLNGEEFVPEDWGVEENLDYDRDFEDRLEKEKCK